MNYNTEKVQKINSKIEELHGEWVNLAKDPETPLEILETLCDFGSERILGYVAQHPNTTPEILLQLGKYTIIFDWKLRSDIASNEKTPVEILHSYSDDEFWQVRSSVAGNRNVPTEILHSFADDPDPNVRFSALRNMIETGRIEFEVVDNIMTYGERMSVE
jgi:hypothetical protein